MIYDYCSCYHCQNAYNNIMTKCVFIKRDVFNLAASPHAVSIAYDSVVPINHIFITLIRVRGSSRGRDVRRSLRVVVRTDNNILLDIPFEAYRLVELFQTNYSTCYNVVLRGFELSGKWFFELHNDSIWPLRVRVSAFSILHSPMVFPVVIDMFKP